VQAIAPETAPIRSGFVCPLCKGELVELRCVHCNIGYQSDHGIPCFLNAAAQSSDAELRRIYDDIYRHHTDVWLDQGRADDFQRYFADLVQQTAPQRLLEIGCGEGNLLAALPGDVKYGIDPSVQALMRARARSAATCAVARCEQLPFPSGFFDAVVAVGVMEHFEDIDAALAEIGRVLAPRGRYLALVQTDMSLKERAILKLKRYLFPHFRPLSLLRWALKWLKKKLRHPINQPMRKSYSIASACDCLRRNGLQVTRIVTQRAEPSAPLGGPHVVILIAGNQSVVGGGA
jgi:ubiquinone/menaquinone biosynthesis C-methylase UbiE